MYLKVVLLLGIFSLLSFKLLLYFNIALGMSSLLILQEAINS